MALAETLNQANDPFGFSKIAAEKSPIKRSQMIREQEPSRLAQESEARLQKTAAGLRAQQKEAEEGAKVEEQYATGLQGAGERFRQVRVQEPVNTIQSFNPNAGVELAAMTALLGAFAGAAGGRAALKSMKGITEGYRLGEEDLYKKSVADFERQLNAYKDNVAMAKTEYEMSLKDEQAKRGAGLARLKAFAPALQDSVAAAHLRGEDLNSYGKTLNDMKTLGDQMTLKLFEAGIKPQKNNFQKLLDSEGRLVITDVSNPAFVPGEVGEGRGGFVGYAAPPGSKGAKGTENDASRKQGERNFSILTNELRNTYNRLQEAGEIRDVNKPFLSNMFVYLATTGVGQEVQRMLGRSPQSDRDYTAGLRASLMNAIREATGLGSRSLDSNKELEFYLQAVTNPTATIQANMQALQSLEALYGNLKTIADNEGLDDASVIESSIRKFGEHEPQKYKYSLSPTGQIQRTPRVQGQEAAMPAQPAAQQQGVDQRAVAIGERYRRGEITQEQAAQELRALGGFQ
jgi:hypothetical protein